MCSLIRVAHVCVRRVTLVIIHIGHEDVVVVIQFCVAILFVIFCIKRCSLYTEANTVNDSQQLGNKYGQGRAHVSPTKPPNSDLDSIDDDTEPIEAPRENVEMGNDDDEELVEAEVPRARMNPMNSTSREKQEHEDSGHPGLLLFAERWCAACVQGPGVGGQHRIELLDEEEKKERLPLLLSLTV